MSEYKIYTLGSKATGYIRETMETCGLSLAKHVLKHLDLKAGQVTTALPSEGYLENIEDFDGGGIIPQPPKSEWKKCNDGSVFVPLLHFDSYAIDNTFMKSKFVIENLRGDTIDTMKSWRILSDDSLNVNLLNGDVLTKEQYDAVTKVIMSTDSIQLDDFILNKGQLGSESTYYLGWAGAMSEAKKTNTVYSIPAKYTIMQSLNGEGDIIIDFSNLIDVDGFSGYTRSVLSDGEILKAYITIYDVENLEASELATILRHEFGHALGLGHSSDPEDLMAPTILTDFPYISECNVDAMAILYDGHESDKAVCEK